MTVVAMPTHVMVPRTHGRSGMTRQSNAVSVTDPQRPNKQTNKPDVRLGGNIYFAVSYRLIVSIFLLQCVFVLLGLQTKLRQHILH